jgi:Arc/MetJ-type ribon-helix-helix transcriptional regulator
MTISMTDSTMNGMIKKITISLPDEQYEAAKAAVAEGRAASVSAYISAALARRHPDQDLLDMLDEMDREYEREHGPVSAAQRAEITAWVRRAVGEDSAGEAAG